MPYKFLYILPLLAVGGCFSPDDETAGAAESSSGAGTMPTTAASSTDPSSTGPSSTTDPATTDLTATDPTTTDPTTTGPATTAPTTSSAGSTGPDPSDGSSDSSSTGGACAAGTADCGSGMCDVNTDDDPLNCGACDHDCLGGECNEGSCAPVQVYLRTALRGIAIDDSYLYTVGGPGSGIADGWGERVDRSFSSPPEDLNFDSSARPRDVQVDATHLFWIEGSNTVNSAVWRTDKDGGSLLELSAGTAAPAKLELNSTTLYWNGVDPFVIPGQNSYYVYAVNKDGGGDATITGPDGSDSIADLIAAPAGPYWTQAGDVDGIRRRTVLVQPIVPDLVSPNNLEIDGNTLFFTNVESGVTTLYTSDLDGNSLTVIATDADPLFNQVTNLLAQDGQLFWFDEDDRGANVLRMADQDGSNAVTLAEGNGDDLRVDDVAIFWRSGVEVLMLAR